MGGKRRRDWDFGKILLVVLVFLGLWRDGFVLNIGEVIGELGCLGRRGFFVLLYERLVVYRGFRFLFLGLKMLKIVLRFFS